MDLDDEELEATRRLNGVAKNNKIYGYSIQNGEPTPDNPVEIKSLDMEDIVNLKEISERFINGTETIEDIMNYCRNYEITFENKETIRVVEKRYFDKLVARIKELEEENKQKDMFVEMAKEVIENSILKQKVKDLKESIILEPTIVGGRRNSKTLEYGIKLGKIKACEELLEEK